MPINLNMRTLVMIGIALVAAAGTALFARSWLNSQRAVNTNQEFAHEVLVAKADIPPGHFVKAQDLRWQGWPKGTLAPSYAVKGKRKPDEFDGAVARGRLVAGQPVTDAMVVRPGEQGFLAAVLGPGKRAVSIQVNAITGISGFVFPGDRVDMVVTHTIRTADGKSSRHVSETVLEDIRVLAVDQKTDDQKGKATVAKTVTFEVTPKQVEKIGIINRIGKISLSLRPIAQEPAPEKAPAPTAPETDAGAAAGAGKPGSTPGRTASLSPIGSAMAAELPADGAPVPLIHPEIGHPEIGAEAAAEGQESGQEGQEQAEVSEEAPVVAEVPAGSVPPRDPVRPRDRAGLTLDTEVSRVIGWDRAGSGRKVQIVRGDKVEEKRF